MVFLCYKYLYFRYKIKVHDTCQDEAPKEQEEEKHKEIKTRSMVGKQKEELKKHFQGAKTRGRIRIFEEEIERTKQMDLLKIEET